MAEGDDDRIRTRRRRTIHLAAPFVLTTVVSVACAQPTVITNPPGTHTTAIPGTTTGTGRIVGNPPGPVTSTSLEVIANPPPSGQ